MFGALLWVLGCGHFSAQRTITINRPMDEVKAISVDGEMRQGARIHHKLGAGPFGAPVKADMDVVIYQPSTAVAFQVVTGPLRPRIAFAFAPYGDSTTVTFSIDAELSGVKRRSWVAWHKGALLGAWHKRAWTTPPRRSTRRVPATGSTACR